MPRHNLLKARSCMLGQRFPIEYRAKVDRYEPYAGTVFETPVFEDVPSGFGFKAMCIEPPATFRFRDRTIELKD